MTIKATTNAIPRKESSFWRERFVKASQRNRPGTTYYIITPFYMHFGIVVAYMYFVWYK